LSPQISVLDICSFCHQYTGAWDILQALTPGTLLAPIYNWFTEGFDTADLQEAQALLQELT